MRKFPKATNAADQIYSVKGPSSVDQLKELKEFNN